MADLPSSTAGGGIFLTSGIGPGPLVRLTHIAFHVAALRLLMRETWMHLA